jgi:CheY-like chemotaxis protein
MSQTNEVNQQILWIDDEALTYTRLYRELVRILGNADRLTLATTVENALASLGSDKRYDLLLLDVMLPQNEAEGRLNLVDLDAGIGLLRDIRQGKFAAADPSIPTVVYTARGNGAKLAELRALLDDNRDILLIKSVPPRKVTDAIAAILARARE